MIVWQKSGSRPLSRVAVAGNFLPASGLQLPDGKTWADVAAGLARYFAKVDVGILNLECCVDIGESKPRPKLGLGDSFEVTSEMLSFPRCLGTKVVGMANNHVYDFGEEGLNRTREAVRQAGLVPLGVGRKLSEIPDVFVAETGAGPRVGVWASARHLPDAATCKKPGIEPATRARGQEALKALEGLGVTLKIAFLHAGLERTNRPDPDDVLFMDDLARMGFDVVTACHSHRISGYKEVHRPDASSAFCFYGLGSISSGVIYSDFEREGIVVVVGVEPSGSVVQIDVQPVRLEEKGWGSIPADRDAYRIMERFLLLSDEIAQGTYKQRFYAEVRSNLLRRPDYFQFETPEGTVFLRCLSGDCLLVDGTSRENYDAITRALGWPAAPGAAGKDEKEKIARAWQRPSPVALAVAR